MIYPHHPLLTQARLDELLSHIKNAPGGAMHTQLDALEKKLAQSLGPIKVDGIGDAGSDAHNRHKQNYQLIDEAGTAYLLTGKQGYADWVRNCLMAYAESYATRPYHQAKNTNPPGKLFHQILNEQIFLLHSTLGYAAIKQTLTHDQAEFIERNLLTPMVEMFVYRYAHDFDRIHNHGLWAVAAVGICGIAIDNTEVVDLAINGLAGDQKSGGFIAQLNQLFSCDGYYVEGPYYQRFALLPLALFALAIDIHRPELRIFERNGEMIRKAVNTLLLTAYPNGCFPAFNDASATMHVENPAVMTALAIAADKYGIDKFSLPPLSKQTKLWLHPGAIPLATIIDLKQAPAINTKSVELREGANGEKGAQGILRTTDRTLTDITQINMNYGQHGLDHGHFDALGISAFNNNQEFICEYGFTRWVNVQSKFGGRYLPENRSWARQTVAHNTVVVDECTQNQAQQLLADEHHGESHFFQKKGPYQAMSAFAKNHYDGVTMQRSVLLLNLPDFPHPLFVDLYRLESQTAHQYDYALHYKGQITGTNVDYHRHVTQRNTMGEDAGYQHLFETARSNKLNSASTSWLQNSNFYTWHTSSDNSELIFAQTGGQDPSFNLKTNDCFLLRTHAKDHLFASIFETHGYFNEGDEECDSSTPQINDLKIIGYNSEASIIQFRYKSGSKEKQVLVMLSNRKDIEKEEPQFARFNTVHYQWQGYFAVEISQETEA